MFDRSALEPLWFPPLNTLIVAEPGHIPHTHEWHWSERHLHCLWYDARLRPEHLRITTGERVTVIDPGQWNLEAGPDFLNATVTIGHRTLKGDVEIHIRPSDWQAHHHTEDPRYAKVILHVTWFPAITDNIPPHIATITLRESIIAMRRFSFDTIDLSAYPHAAIPSSPRPCGEQLANATSTEIHALLEDAGMSRLRRKTMRMAARLQITGSRYQTFYEACMAALGYKPNAQGMQSVAERMPLDRLTSYDTFRERYAVLLGVAGLLPTLPGRGKNETASEARQLWDLAWKLGVADTPDRPNWILAGTRPINHPRQRLATAASLFDVPKQLLEAFDAIPQDDGKTWAKAATAAIQSKLKNTRASVPASFQNALRIGPQRTHAILVNVVVPLLMAEDRFNPACLKTLPGEAANQQITETAYRLFGRDHNPALYRSSGLMMQGLLEIWNGFCLSTKSACTNCPLVEALRQSNKKGPA